MSAPKNALTWKHKVGYGLGDFGGCMTFALMGSFATRYYVNVLQINTAVLATLLLIWNVWDAVNDPMMGALMDKMFAKKRHKNGKFRPWLLRSTPLLAISAIAFWTVPTFFEGTALICVLFVCKLLYEGAYTMFNIPMGTLLSAMADTDEERAVLSSARGFGATVGNYIPAMIFPLLLEKFGDTAAGYGYGATVCAAIGFVCCLLHYFWTEERNLVETKTEVAENIKFTDIFDVITKNRPFLALCIHGICYNVMVYVSYTLMTYLYSDVMGNIGMMATATTVSTVMSVASMLVAPALAKRYGLEKTIRVGLMLSAVMFVGLFAAHMTMSVNVWIHVIVYSLAENVAALSVLMQWGLVGEAIEYNEYITGKRTEGSIYGTFNLARRFGQTLGNSAAVLVLGAVGYDATLAAQSAATITGIKASCVLAPGIFVIGCWAAFKFVWNITPELRAKMAAKKAEKAI